MAIIPSVIYMGLLVSLAAKIYGFHFTLGLAIRIVRNYEGRFVAIVPAVQAEEHCFSAKDQEGPMIHLSRRTLESIVHDGKLVCGRIVSPGKMELVIKEADAIIP